MSDAWLKLKTHTRARIGLPRAGHALATSEWLKFQLAHARARDAVSRDWDWAALAAKVNGEVLFSRAKNRKEYLVHPGLGRRLAEPSSLEKMDGLDVALVVSDGLSARAIENEFLPLWGELAPRLTFKFSKIYLVPFGRVAVADEIGERLGAAATLIFIGERPGLSTPASLGIYLTFGPKVGNHDAQRNCLSNIHSGGMSAQDAAVKTVNLLKESLRLHLSGVGLKEHDTKLVGAAPHLQD